MEDQGPYGARAAIGDRLRRYREKAGLTQIELSEALGHRSSQRINQIELGRSRLYVEELEAICRALEISVSDLVYSEPPWEEIDLQMLMNRLEPFTRELLTSALYSVIREMEAPCANLQRKLHQLSNEQLIQVDAIVSAMIPRQ